jgi:hypothetical protein
MLVFSHGWMLSGHLPGGRTAARRIGCRWPVVADLLTAAARGPYAAIAATRQPAASVRRSASAATSDSSVKERYPGPWARCRARATKASRW